MTSNVQQAPSKYRIDADIVSFISETPFFAEISRHITKIRDDSVGTASVSYNMLSDSLVMRYSPTWMGGLCTRHRVNIIRHELSHIMLGHLSFRRRKPHMRWNEATDLAINSLIVTGAEKHPMQYPDDPAVVEHFPPGCLIPGVPPNLDGIEKHPKELQDRIRKYYGILEKLPPLMSSEWYFDKIYQEDPERDDDLLEGFLADKVGDHSFWDDIPEEHRERIKSKISGIIEKAVNAADSSPNGWGNIPVELQRDIRASITHVINWKQQLRRFVGYLNPGGRKTTIRKINRRFPYMYPGTTKGRIAKLLIAIDMSGSVGDDMLAEFGGELNALTKTMTIDVVGFDTEVDEGSLYTWKKGQRLDIKRTRTGGTNFDGPTCWVNKEENRGRWDGVLILTDGQAPKPQNCNIKRGWVIGAAGRLAFTPDPEDETIHLANVGNRNWVG